MERTELVVRVGHHGVAPVDDPDQPVLLDEDVVHSQVGVGKTPDRRGCHEVGVDLLHQM